MPNVLVISSLGEPAVVLTASLSLDLVIDVLLIEALVYPSIAGVGDHWTAFRMAV